MTMLSFRAADEDAAAVQRWADLLGIDRSELLRSALRRHLAHLAAEQDTRRWASAPPTEAEASLASVAEWGPAEDWSDWADAAG